jgi:hypothetical protein
VTDEMVEAGRKAAKSHSLSKINEWLEAIYTAMHAASPNPEASEIMREALERIQQEDTRTERTPHLSYANDRELWTERKVEGRCAKIAREALSLIR